MAEVVGQPTIRLSKSCLSQMEKKAAMEVLDHAYLGMGEEVRRFEEELSDFFGRPTVCVVNGTAALHLAVQACGIGPGDEVLVPSLTYVASFQAISATGATPVACDINADDLQVSLKDMEQRLTDRTRAVMPVHYSGDVGNLDALYAFAGRFGLRVIEDAAHAFGSVYRGRMVGSFGDIACFSFDGIKNITSGEGGCIVTSDKEVLERVRDARLLGVEKDTEKRYSGSRSWQFDVTHQGWRYHMSNLMAAIGIEQLRSFQEKAVRRQQLAMQYDSLLSGCEVISCFKRDYQKIVPHIYVVRIPGMEERKMLQEKLIDKGVETGVHYQPNHWLDYYSTGEVQLFPVVDAIYPELLTLPLHPEISSEDVEYICKVLIESIE